MKIFKATLRGVSKSLVRLTFTLVLILLLSFIPTIYQLKRGPYGVGSYLQFSFESYYINLVDYLHLLLKGKLGFYGFDSNREIGLDIFNYFNLTVGIFLPGLLLGIVLGVFAAFFTLLMKPKKRELPQILSLFTSTIPDFMVIILIQIAIIYLYKKTGIKFLAIATGGNSKAILLPILVLALFPFSYIYRSTLNSFEDIISNRYVLTAYSKGLAKVKVLFSHVLKNGLINTLTNLPSIIMPTVSNLFIVEYLFNTHGITTLAIRNIYNPQINLHLFIISSVLIWLMVELILLINSLILKMFVKDRGAEYA